MRFRDTRSRPDRLRRASPLDPDAPHTNQGPDERTTKHRRKPHAPNHRPKTKIKTKPSRRERPNNRRDPHLSTSQIRTSPSKAAARPAPSKIPSCVMAAWAPLPLPPPPLPPAPLSPERKPLRWEMGCSLRDHTRTSPSAEPVSRIDSECFSTAMLVTGALPGCAKNEACRLLYIRDCGNV